MCHCRRGQAGLIWSCDLEPLNRDELILGLGGLMGQKSELSDMNLGVFLFTCPGKTFFPHLRDPMKMVKDQKEMWTGAEQTSSLLDPFTWT